MLAESLKLHRSHRTLRSFPEQLEEKAKRKINIKKLGITIMIEIKRLLARPPIWYIIYYATRVLKFLTGQKLLTKVKSTTGKGL